MTTDAGRKLDALVAERVMGMRVRDGLGEECASTTPFRGACLYNNGEGRSVWVWRGALPAYSTDIAAAWEVVEKMLGSFNVVSVTGDVMVGPAWMCQIGDADASMPFAEARADTAPLAICRAALAALATPHDQRISEPSGPNDDAT